MVDYSRMFENKPAAVVKPKPTADVFSNSTTIMEWRKDLSEKVKEHVETVEKMVREDSNVIAAAEEKLHAIAKEVMELSEKKPKSWFSIFTNEQEVVEDIPAKVKAALEKIEVELKPAARHDPFKAQDAARVVEQARYLADQLAKAGAELEKMKTPDVDDLIVDCVNRRCATLYKQQQLVAMGMEQVKQLASDIQTRPQQVDDLLHAVIPMYKLLCLDVLSGSKQPTELRKLL